MLSTTLAQSASPPVVRVMVVDDSVVMRGFISRMVTGAGASIEVVATAANGQLAVERLRKGDIDVVVLDVEMPVMDGLAALPQLLAIDSKLVVIMASSLTTRNADISLRALSVGAKDYVSKPSSTGAGTNNDEFQRELVEKIKTLAARFRPAVASPPRTLAVVAPVGETTFKLRPVSPVRPRVLAIGSSTGGPHALGQLLRGLPRPVKVPVLITQHMPSTFTGLLAQNLSRDTGILCVEAQDGEVFMPGKAYIAPGDFHMLAVVKGGQPVVQLTKDEKVHFCRPAVDPMLRSAVTVFHRNVLAAIVTGMGTDGLAGSTVVANAGGNVVAQDEASSVVWGMPGAVAKAGVCCDVVPLDRLGRRLGELLGA